MNTFLSRHLFTIGLVLLLGPVSAMRPASTLSKPTDYDHPLERAVRHQIDRHVIFPLSDNAEAMYGTVEVAFVVNSKGRLVVQSSRSKNPALRDYVLRKLAKVQVRANPSGIWKTSRVRFTFRPE